MGILAEKPTEEQTVFNYRLSRAHHVIENTFGILSANFAGQSFQSQPEKLYVID